MQREPFEQEPHGNALKSKAWSISYIFWLHALKDNRTNGGNPGAASNCLHQRHRNIQMLTARIANKKASNSGDI